MTATTEPDTGWAPPPPDRFTLLRRRHPWLAPTLVGGAVALGTAYTAWQDPNQSGSLFPGCPLREMTGLDCPGCGGTRALHALTHGDVGAALDHNAVLTVLLPLLAIVWGVWMAHALRTTLAQRRDRPLPAWPAALRPPKLSQRAWLGVIGFFIAFAVVRNISAVPVLDFLASEA